MAGSKSALDDDYQLEVRAPSKLAPSGLAPAPESGIDDNTASTAAASSASSDDALNDVSSTVSSDAASDALDAVQTSERRGLWQRMRSSIAGIVGSRRAPGFLVSLILHTTLLLLLALWTVAASGRSGSEFGVMALVENDNAGVDVEITDLMLASGEVTPQAESSAAAQAVLPGSAIESISAGSMGADLQDLANAPGVAGGQRAETLQSAAGDLVTATASSINATLGVVNIDGRKPQSRQRLALERGGSAESEAAVELALEWLAAHQRPNGSWSLVHTTDQCDGSCTHPGSPERYDPAATGLALLAFVGAGYTHRDGKYAAAVKKGLYYLLQIMEQTPQGGSFLHSCPQGMYNQGVASFALCEIYQLSGDQSLRAPSQKAVDFIVNAQNEVGGWGYLPKRPGDLTITGWQTMALKSADGAELYIPASVIVRIDKFLDSQTDDQKIFYGYGAPGKSETCTAIGLLLRLFRNWSHTDPRVLSGVSYLEHQGISAHDIYRNYYATLLLYHVGGGPFHNWNPRMRESLIKSQSRSGHSAGSWYFDDKFGETGGRLYTTAMAAMTLEVYYRFSPIYLNSDRPFEY